MNRDTKPDNVLDGFSFRVDRIVSDAQSGAARGALDAAIELGISHGGGCAFERKADDGPLDARYLMHPVRGGFAERCAHNIRYSDGTLLVSLCSDDDHDGRTAHTRRFAAGKRKPSAFVQVYVDHAPGPNTITSTRQWLAKHRIRTLHVTGPLEAKEPGLAMAVKRLLVAVLRVEGAGA